MSSKKVLGLILILLISGIMHGIVGAQEWSEPIRITTGDTPDIDIDPKTGNLHVKDWEVDYIPEFSDIIIPVLGLITFTLIFHKRKKKKNK